MRFATLALHTVGCLLLLVQREAIAAAAAGSDENSLAIACASHLSAANLANGFGAEVDDDCRTDSAECFQIVCRLCEEQPTKSTTGLRACEAVRAKQAARNQAASKLLQPKELSLESAAIFEAAPLSSADCAARVSKGDQDAGLTAIYNAGCADGGLGCFSDVHCQYCRIASAKTAQFKLCSEISGSAAAVPAPSTLSTDCDTAVKNSGYSGAKFVIDPECLKADAPSGCVVASTCRLCRETKDEGNQHLALCKVLNDQQALAKAASAAEAANVAKATSAAETTLVMATSTTSAMTANTKAGGDVMTPPATGSGGWEPVPIIAAATVGAVMALLAVAIKNSRARRVANGSGGGDNAGDLHRIDSILQGVGRDRIATL